LAKARKPTESTAEMPENGTPASIPTLPIEPPAPALSATPTAGEVTEYARRRGVYGLRDVLGISTTQAERVLMLAQRAVLDGLEHAPMADLPRGTVAVGNLRRQRSTVPTSNGTAPTVDVGPPAETPEQIMSRLDAERRAYVEKLNVRNGYDNARGVLVRPTRAGDTDGWEGVFQERGRQ
jgi:hypothetical protein